MMLGQEGFRLRVPVTAFLAANILIFTAPMKALAETCEADNSFFNMPLLLFVALIGATVGGTFYLASPLVLVHNGMPLCVLFK